MKILNPKSLPEYFQYAAESSTYKPDPNTFYVTQLIGCPLIRTLLIEKWDELSENVEDRLWALDGTAFDEFVKKHSRWALTNIKLRLETPDGIISGRPDFYHVLDYVLADLKVTSVWNLKEPRKEWEYQLNVYDYLMKKIVPQLRIDKLEIHGKSRDWRKNEKLRYRDYPEKSVVLPINRWSFEEQEQYIDTQLKDHILNPYRECSDEEKWKSEDKFAVMGMDRKSAHRVLDTNDEAMAWALEKGKATRVDGVVELKNKIYIEKRKGDCIKCNDYCSVASVCPYRNKN